jgi:hypothetical protein
VTRRTDGRNLVLYFGAVSVACDSTSVMLDNDDGDADLVTFADVLAGNDKRWFFVVSGYPDYGPGTFWSLLWDTPPFTPIGYSFSPYGGELHTPETPFFDGQCVVDRKPPIGGNAGSTWTFDARLTCTATPTRQTG